MYTQQGQPVDDVQQGCGPLDTNSGVHDLRAARRCESNATD